MTAPLTPTAREALIRAREVLSRNSEVGSLSHAVLLVMAEMDHGVGPAVLRTLGINSHVVPVKLHSQPRSTGDAELLAAAAREAQAFRHGYIGTEHFLLASLDESLLRNAINEHVGDLRLIHAEVWRALLDGSPGGAWEAELPEVSWNDVHVVLDKSLRAKVLEPWGEKASALIRDVLGSEPHVGLVAGVAREGTLLYTAEYGWTDVYSRAPVTVDTSFAVGSITKLLTALAILRLAHLKVIALDDPANAHLQTIVVESMPGCGAITVRHLLTHTAGLGPGHGLRHYGAGSPPSLEELFGSRLVAQSPLGRWSYSNLGYWVLGLMIEDITGIRWHDWVEREILRPLGLSRTSVEPRNSELTATGHVVTHGNVVRVRRSSVVAAPAGAFWSTLLDLAKLAGAIGHPTICGLLSPALAHSLTQLEIDTGQPERRQAIGFFVEKRKSGDVAFHTGDWPGFHAALALDLATGHAAVALANTDTGRLLHVVFELLTKAR